METIAATVEPSIGQDAQDLLENIAEYCRRAGLSQSTFGRLAVNDGKVVDIVTRIDLIDYWTRQRAGGGA